MRTLLLSGYSDRMNDEDIFPTVLGDGSTQRYKYPGSY